MTLDMAHLEQSVQVQWRAIYIGDLEHNALEQRWKRNKRYNKKKNTKNILEVLYFTCSFI